MSAAAILGSDLVSLRDAIASRAISAEAATRATLDRAERLNPTLNAFHELHAERAIARAREIDVRLARGDAVGPLAGVPIAIKDNIATSWGSTTCSSKILAGFKSPYHATIVERLESAGAILFGKTNMDELAMGSSGETCAWGPVRNPWDTSRVPGGSSAGSAAAVAAGICHAALGSDTGGSIRQPAAFSALVGLKPTYGRVSRYGLVAFGSSLDQIGPLTRSVRDAALVHSVMAGHDHRDSTSATELVGDPVGACDDRAADPASLKGLQVGIPSQYLTGNHPGVDALFARARAQLHGYGATLVEVELPLTEVGISTYYVIAPAEASSNLARYDGIRYGHRTEQSGDLFDLYSRSRSEGFGTEVKRRIMLGTYVLSSGYYDAYYRRALQVRRLIKQEFDTAFAKCDVILGPTAPTPAFRIGAVQDPVTMYMNDVYTVNANIAGICAVSLYGGMAKDSTGSAGDGTASPDLPIGLQLQAPAFQEPRLLAIACAFESMLGRAPVSPIAPIG